MSIKLTELKAKFVRDFGEGFTRIGVVMNCPCGCEYALYVPFLNPIGTDKPATGWQRTGESIDTLTLSPSIQRNEPCPTKWHGFVRNGEAETC